MNIDKELSKVGLTRKKYEALMSDIRDKQNGLNDLEWEEIAKKHHLEISGDALRKNHNRPFGGAFASEYYMNLVLATNEQEKIDKKLQELRAERIKIQTLNTERNRVDRSTAKQMLYYENVASVIKALPVPKFEPINKSKKCNMSYVVTLADIHYGATFHSQNNEYSRDIAKKRLEYLCGQLKKFVKDHNIHTLYIADLGDTIQGILRISDLNVNDTAIVRCVVEVSRLLALFLNKLSTCVNIEYYHTPTANHSQLRFLNAKASELADEDVEYVIGNYIKDLCVNNSRINVHLADDGCEYIKMNIPFGNIYLMHGHQIKNIDNSIRDLSFLVDEHISYLLLGHFHNGREIPNHETQSYDAEVLVSPSFIGSDPYSDRIMKGCKAAVKIYGFDDKQGHIESYKILLS